MYKSIDPGMKWDADMEWLTYGPLRRWALEALLGLDHIDWAGEHEGQVYFRVNEKFYVVRNNND